MFIRFVYLSVLVLVSTEDRTFLIAGAGASPNPCKSTYRGSGPFSEVETDNVRNFLKDLDDQGKLKGFIDFHAYSQMWFIPWGYKSDPTADYEEQVFNFHCYWSAFFCYM